MEGTNLLSATPQGVSCTYGKGDSSHTDFYQRHDNYEIYLLLNGSVNFYLEHHGYHMEKGSLLFIRPDIFHRFEVLNRDSCEGIRILIKDNYFHTLNTTQTNLSDVISTEGNGTHVSFHLSESQMDTFLQKSLDLEKTLHWQRFGDDILSECLLKELLILVNRLPRNKDTIQQPDLFMPSLVTDLIAYIDKNLSQDLSLNALGTALGHNGQYLSHRFRQSMGITLQQYILHQRIDQAKKLLKKGYPLTKACFASGFRDYSNFSKMFSKYTGVSPKQYQLQSVNIWLG